MAPMKVAIIGAGPAGCLLARLLHMNTISVTIFEADSSFDARSQGGTLDLHPKTGIAALKASNLYEEFLKHARFDGSALTVCDKNAQPYFQLPRLFASNPEIDRLQLRQIFLDSIPSHRIRWGKALHAIERDMHQKPTDAKDIVMHFADGSTETGFRLVVGADGAWSKVRSLVSRICAMSLSSQMLIF